MLEGPQYFRTGGLAHPIITQQLLGSSTCNPVDIRVTGQKIQKINWSVDSIFIFLLHCTVSSEGSLHEGLFDSSNYYSGAWKISTAQN